MRDELTRRPWQATGSGRAERCQNKSHEQNSEHAENKARKELGEQSLVFLRVVFYTICLYLFPHDEKEYITWLAA